MDVLVVGGCQLVVRWWGWGGWEGMCHVCVCMCGGGVGWW